MPRYLTVAEVIELHRAILERMGGRLESLRDEGLLESALMRAQMAAHYEQADLVTQAVLMAIGISQNQPFVDGNKRAGFVTFDVFLRINGLMYQGDGLELATRIVEVAGLGRSRAGAIDALVQVVRDRTHSI